MTTENLEAKWEKTKHAMNFHEQKLINSLLQFLRDTAEFFIKRGNNVFFRENTVVHWGEGGFGTLYIIGTEKDESLLPGYLAEIQVVDTAEDVGSAAKEITLKNLNEIKYKMDPWL